MNSLCFERAVGPERPTELYVATDWTDLVLVARGAGTHQLGYDQATTASVPPDQPVRHIVAPGTRVHARSAVRTTWTVLATPLTFLEHLAPRNTPRRSP